MSFDPQFTHRWENVIEPAINALKIGTDPLKAVRVDRRRTGNSIQAEIIDGIRSSALVFADISTIAYVTSARGQLAIRNSNVMYEVGLAHAIRSESEVILFRSDNDALNFDLANIRVNRYDPEARPTEAIDAIQTALIEGSKETDLMKTLTVNRLVESLDVHSCAMLIAVAAGEVTAPKRGTVRDALAHAETFAALRRMLELGLISAKYPHLTPDSAVKVIDSRDQLQTYTITALGRAVAGALARRLGVTTWAEEEVEKHLGPIIKG